MTRFAIPDGGQPRTAQEVSYDSRCPTGDYQRAPRAISARVAATTDGNARRELGETTAKAPNRQIGEKFDRTRLGSV